MKRPLFDLGRIVATPGALRLFEEKGADPLLFLSRHITGDWSEMSEDDQEANRHGVLEGSRVFSAYSVCGVKVWIITEADRSATTFLLPDEY